MTNLNKKYLMYLLSLISVLIGINIDEIFAYNSINFKNITNEDGLPQASAEAIIQDDNGYIWIGTNDGLCRYNGYEFKVYKHDEDNENSITNNYIVDIKQDLKGNIWIGTANGLSKLNPKTDVITNYNMGEKERNLSHYNIGDILITECGRVLVGTSDGLNLYDEEHDKFERILNRSNDLSSQHIYSLAEDKNKNIWIAYIWIGTNDGLCRYNGYEFKVYKHDEDNENSITNNYIVDIKQDLKGNIWIGTANGLSKLNPKTDVITNYNMGEKERNLSHYNIGDILITECGRVLVGTSDGLNLYDEEHDKFERILNRSNDLSSQHIYSLAEDKNKNIWIATNEGIDKFDVKNKTIKRFKAGDDKYSISEKSVYVIKSDKKGYIWAGTIKEGLNKIDINTDEVKQYKNDYNNEKSLPGNYVKDILRDSKDNLWIATDSGIAKYNDETEEFTTYKNKIYDRTSLVDDEVFSILEDDSGLIWVGTYAGISIFDPNTDISHYKKDPFDENTLSDNSIHGIYQDGDGLIWVGTNSKGANIIDRENDKVYHINLTHQKFQLKLFQIQLSIYLQYCNEINFFLYHPYYNLL